MSLITQRTYTLEEVVAEGFEAHCLGADGCRYLWHHDQGLRHNPSTGVTTLVTSPAALPEGPWLATSLGELELAGDETG